MPKAGKFSLKIANTKSGLLSVIFIVLMPAFISLGSLFFNTLYANLPAGNSIAEDIVIRPWLALSMLSGIFSGVLAFFVGVYAIVRKKEKSLFTYASVAIGFFLLIFLVGEAVFPH